MLQFPNNLVKEIIVLLCSLILEGFKEGVKGVLDTLCITKTISLKFVSRIVFLRDRHRAIFPFL